MDAGMSSDGVQRVNDLVRGYVDSGRYAGTVSLVARHGEVVHLGVHGMADVERGVPMRPDTLFRIYSMTKPVVSVALMRLYERGLFQLDDPAAEYLPELSDLKVHDGDGVRDPQRPMTVRDLLMHTSGLVGYRTRGPVSELYRRNGIDRLATIADLPAALSELPLQADPGTRWTYGISTDLVGLLIEVIGGQPLDVHLRENIFTPLGMPDTGFAVPESAVDRFAALYARKDNGFMLQEAPQARNPTYLSGSAGLVSTAGDYLRFARMLAGGGALDGVRILGSRTLKFMSANHLPDGRDLVAMADTGGETKRAGQGFGLGFGVLLDPAVAQTIGTPGEIFWGGMASTAFFVSPADDLVAIFLTQLVPSASYPIRRQLRAAVYSAIVD